MVTPEMRMMVCIICFRRTVPHGSWGSTVTARVMPFCSVFVRVRDYVYLTTTYWHRSSGYTRVQSSLRQTRRCATANSEFSSLQKSQPSSLSSLCQDGDAGWRRSSKQLDGPGGDVVDLRVGGQVDRDNAVWRSPCRCPERVGVIGAGDVTKLGGMPCVLGADIVAV